MALSRENGVFPIGDIARVSHICMWYTRIPGTADHFVSWWPDSVFYFKMKWEAQWRWERFSDEVVEITPMFVCGEWVPGQPKKTKNSMKNIPPNPQDPPYTFIFVVRFFVYGIPFCFARYTGSKFSVPKNSFVSQFAKTSKLLKPICACMYGNNCVHGCTKLPLTKVLQ